MKVKNIKAGAYFTFIFVLFSLCVIKTDVEAADVKISQVDIDTALPGIACWGDSLTDAPFVDGVNYPVELGKLIDARLIEPLRVKSGNASLKAPEVVNLGVSGETTLDIAGREGGIPFVVAKDFVIPAGIETVDLEFVSAENHTETKILIAGNGGVTRVYIDGVEGELIRWFDTKEDSSKYKFHRLTAGESVQVKAGDPMITNLYFEYLDYIPIIMMGGNGGWENDEDLEAQVQAMLAHTNSKDKYIIAARPINEEQNIQVIAQEDADMAEAFGDHAISVREWMIQYGLQTAGIAATTEDAERVQNGQIPSSLMLPDRLHFTKAGIKVMAEMFYQKLDQLGYFEGLKVMGE